MGNLVEVIDKTEKEILYISYFDQILGPNQFYCETTLDDFDHSKLNRILEFTDEPGSYIVAFHKYRTINFIFFIKSEYARGGEDTLMISYIIRTTDFKNDFIDFFKYLESKEPILVEFANELKNFKELSNILHKKDKNTFKKSIIELGTENFKNEFLELYSKYFNKLSLKGSLNIKGKEENSIINSF
jgi:hypothetical protein